MLKTSSYNMKGMKPRLYQETILHSCVKGNCLVVLPTGMGKTTIALMLAIQRLKNFPNSKVLFLAPTKPLVEQHKETFKKYMDIDEDELAVFTGNVSPAKREELWENAKIVFSTPQGLENDVISRRINLEEVTLMIYDECHRAVGDYAYVFLAKQYIKLAKYPKILGLTASPGSEADKIEEVCKNLFIDSVEIRTDEDPDVRPYIQDVKMEWIKVNLPASLKEIQVFLQNCFKSKIKELHKYGLNSKRNLSKKDLLRLQGMLHSEIAKGNKDFKVFKSISLAAEAMKVQHALELLETQGITPLYNYFENIEEQSMKTKSKAVQNLVKDINFKSALIKTRNLHEKGIEHPKLDELKRITGKEAKDDTKIIIFTQFRDTASKISEEINKIDNVNARIFVGQAKKKGTGLSQKQQKEMLDEFSNGMFNTLIATSVHPDEHIILKKGNKIKIKKIGEFVNFFIKEDGTTSKKISGWKALTTNGKKMLFKPITHVHKHLTKNKVFNIRTSAGFDCKITENHSLFSFSSKQSFVPSVPKLKKFVALALKCPDIRHNKKIDVIRELKENCSEKELKNLFGNIEGINQPKMRMLKTDLHILSSLNKKELNISELSKISKKDYSTACLCLKRLKEKGYVTQRRINKNFQKISRISKNGLIYLDFLKWFFDNVKYKKGKYKFWLMDIKNKEKFNKFFKQSANVNYGKVAFPRIIKINKELAQFLGFYVSEGHTRKTKNTSNVFLAATKKQIQKMMKISIEKGLNLKTRTNWKGVSIDSQIAFHLIKSVFRAGIGAYNKEVPEFIFTAPEEIKWEFLKAYFLGDGHLRNDRITLTTVSEKLVTGIVLLLRMLKINKLTIHKQKNIYRINVFESFPFAKIKEKNEKVCSTYYSLIPNALNSKKAFVQFKNYYSPSKSNLTCRKIGKWKADICFDYIKDIKKIKKPKFVYDLSVKDTENFIGGNGLFSLHNSVAEEGLDIPKVDLVIFHEPIPSAIRHIQRRGRTGRLEKGKVTILVTRNTRDEGYKWSAFNKEKRMHRTLRDLKNSFQGFGREKENLKKYLAPEMDVEIYADDREKNGIVKQLVDLGIKVNMKRMGIGDYILSKRCAVEYKKIPDFVDSIIDGRLLQQIKQLKQNYERPLLILEGTEDIYSQRKIHPNAIRGMLATITISYGIPIINTKTFKETANLIAIIAKREQDEKIKGFDLHSAKPLTLKEQQEYIVSAFPGIGSALAKPLLKKFKSIRNIVNASEEELKKVEKIGKKKAKEIQKVLDSEYRA